MAKKEIRTFCGICPSSCAQIVTVEDGKIISVKVDRESGYRHAICPGAKGPLTSMEMVDHPGRLKYPLKRVGERGGGRWERISWDDALDFAAQRLLDLKEKFGPESTLICLGEPKNMETAFLHRFATVFGTPNIITPGCLCGEPHLAAAIYTYGRPAVPDEPEQYTEGTVVPRVFLEWGADYHNHLGRHLVKTFTDHGTKLIVVDPMEISAAKKTTELWIRPRPGGDGALAMGVLKVIIDEELYDKDFTARWTVGFEQMRDEVSTFTLDEVEKVSWVPKEQIKQLARLFATNRPASMHIGNAIDCQANAFKVQRVMCIVRAITGNINIPGGDVFIKPARHMRPGNFMLLSEIGRKTENAIAQEFPLALKGAYTPYQLLMQANLEGKLYPIRSAINCICNPLLSYPDSEATYQCFMKMDFIVVLELFMTPMAALADLVLPAAWTWEDDTIGYWYGAHGEVRAYPKIVDPPGEAWSDAKIVNELAKRMGMAEYFWDDERESLDYFLTGSGLSFEQALRRRKLMPSREYKTPEEEPYKTPSGKIEIYSKALEDLGYEPIPRWKTLSRLAGELSDEYPLLATQAKSNVFYLTAFKMLDKLRKREPEPLVKLNPETASMLGLKEGEWVYIETKKGKISQKLALDQSLDPRVAVVAWGWWYPEEGPETMYGWRKSNYNILTGYEDMGEECGSPELRGLPCRVYKT
jgi:anaerobic selenocysteine-containing dehydrogenase